TAGPGGRIAFRQMVVGAAIWRYPLPAEIAASVTRDPRTGSSNSNHNQSHNENQIDNSNDAQHDWAVSSESWASAGRPGGKVRVPGFGAQRFEYDSASAAAKNASSIYKSFELKSDFKADKKADKFQLKTNDAQRAALDAQQVTRNKQRAGSD